MACINLVKALLRVFFYYFVASCFRSNAPQLYACLCDGNDKEKYKLNSLPRSRCAASGLRGAGVSSGGAHKTQFKLRMRRNRYESHVFRLEPVERCPMQCMYGGGDGDRVTMTPTALVACNAMPQPLKWKRHLSREESTPLTGALERMVLVAIQRRTMRFIYYNSSGAVKTILVICQRL